MANETKPAVVLFVFLLTHVDIEKAYKLCLEIAEDNKATLFQGIYAWSLTNPNRDAEYLHFITDVDLINTIIEKVKLRLNLTEENLLYTINPFVRPKEKLPSSNMAT